MRLCGADEAEEGGLILARVRFFSSSHCSPACSGRLLANAWHGVSRGMKTSYWHPASPSFSIRVSFPLSLPLPQHLPISLSSLFLAVSLFFSFSHHPHSFFTLVLNYKVRLWLKIVLIPQKINS